MKVDVKDLRSGKLICTLDGLEPSSTIADVKKQFHTKKPKFYPDRQQFKISQEKKVKGIKDNVTLESLEITDEGTLFFKDLGTQISWTKVFLIEYTAGLLGYLIFYPRPALIYGEDAAQIPRAPVVNIAVVCWTLHYLKRLYETLFVHRFSLNTMPVWNLFRNSAHYGLFALYISYYINHPLYTPPYYGVAQVYIGLVIIVICEYGNYSIHAALRDLRPPGSRERRIPYPTSNPMTFLFNLVSCPNYTYEIGSWIGFSIMTQSVPALLFTLFGGGQMYQWAHGKHRNYIKEFEKYPKGRKAIIPLLS